MIETDKYEGHTEGPWIWHDWFAPECESSCRLNYVVGRRPKGMIITECSLEKQFEKGDTYDYFDYKAVIGEGANEADIQLIADAPLLLEEVKRLREENHVLRMVDWEYERVWEWLMENADHTCRKLLLLIEEWKEEDGLVTIDGRTYEKEMIE
jgi:hypothetical protein